MTRPAFPHFQSKDLKPLRFHGDPVCSEMPYFGPDQVAPKDPVLIAKINYHFDHCRVIKIVRVVENGRLSEDDLNDPTNEPWFLIMGSFRGILRYFIVNDDDYYLPVIEGNHDDFDNPDNFSILNPAAYKEELKVTHANGTTAKFIYEWDKFSSIDLDLVKEAITIYTRVEY